MGPAKGDRVASTEFWTEQDEPDAPPRPGISAIFAALALALLGFCGAAALMRGLLPADKLDLYAEFRSEKRALLASSDISSITTAAFGSSHVHQSFLPPAWDAAFGLPGHAFNDAVSGGSQTEQRRMAFDFLGRPGARPCLMIFELSAGLNFPSDKLTHPRVINLYDSDTLNFVEQYGGAANLAQKAGRLGFAFAAAGENLVNLGMGSGYLLKDRVEDRIWRDNQSDDHRGFSPTPIIPRELQKAEADMRALPATAPAQRNKPLAPGATILAREMFMRGPKEMQIVYVNMPVIADLGAPIGLPDAMDVDGHRVPIVNVGHDAAFPMLRDIRAWSDPGHMSEPGAALFSRALAQVVAARIDRAAYSRCEALRAVH